MVKWNKIVTACNKQPLQNDENLATDVCSPWYTHCTVLPYSHVGTLERVLTIEILQVSHEHLGRFVVLL